jgi:hypothetical protein
MRFTGSVFRLVLYESCLYTAYTIGVYTLMQTLLVKSRPLNFQEHRRALLHPTATVSLTFHCRMQGGHPGRF